MTEYKTREQIFEKAWNGLKSQGFVQAMGSFEICSYKTESGLRCAIGWCMPEDLEIPPVGTVYNIEVQKLAGIKAGDIEFAQRLQYIHDQCAVPDNMKQRLIGFAYAHDLVHLISISSDDL